MSFETNRRRFLALASLAFSAAGGGAARAQGSPGFSSDDPVPREYVPPPPEPLPEGVPENPADTVIKDIGSWRIVSQFNNADAFIPHDRIKIASGGVKSFAPGGKGMHVVAEEDGSGETGGTELLIGGKGELKLNYTPQRKAFTGTLRLATTSNMQSGFKATVILDGTPIRTVDVPGYVDLAVTDLFGADLLLLRQAKSLVVTVEGNDPYTIYAVDLVDTDAALKQMQLIPDYNYNIRRLGRLSEQQEWEREHNPPPPGQCFLTTACCEVVGLPDDCFELTALRRFRDRVMRASPAGRRDVERYYRTAPAILAAMAARGETGRLRGVYFGTILPCALLASLGLNRPTRQLYTRMMRDLDERYRSGSL